MRRDQYIATRYILSMARSRSTPRDNLTDTDFQLLAEFRYTLRRFLHFSTEAAEDAWPTAQVSDGT